MKPVQTEVGKDVKKLMTLHGNEMDRTILVQLLFYSTSFEVDQRNIGNISLGEPPMRIVKH